MFSSQWQKLVGKMFRSVHTRRTAPRMARKPFRLALEPIEDRIVPNTVTVMDSSDNPSDTNSLRYILAHATSGETIDFAPDVRTIDLSTLYNTSGLTISKNVIITNDQGTGTVTIDGEGLTVFTIDAGLKAVSLSGLTITGGANGIVNSGSLDVDNCTITENTEDGFGGGIYNGANTAGFISMSNCTISNNSSSDCGGGLYNSSGTVIINNCTISDDSANATGGYAEEFGGGIFNLSTLTINNSTISGNTVSTFPQFGNNSDGGGIYNSHQLTITNSTITDNSVTVVGGPAYGGGIANLGGTPILNGDIVAGNSVAGTSGTIDNDIYTVAGANLSNASADNVIGTGGSGGLVNGTNGNQVGVAFANINLDPSGLENNGGPTQTIALEPGSLAIGTGYTETSATTDQRGVPRPIGIPSDVGAYQLSSAPLVTTNPSNVTIDPGTTTANFTAAAVGYPTPTVQWQVSINDGINFTNLTDGGDYSGSATDTLNISGITTSMNGYEYRALFSNTPVGASLPETATTSVATLTVDYAPSITGNPVNQTINTGGTTTFSSAASGNPTPTVQWQVSSDGGNTFTNISNGGVYSGATTDTLTITNAGSEMNGYEYQAIFTNTLSGASNSSTAASNPATLFVDYAPSVITNPNNQPLNSGGQATFTVAASGWPIPGIQWQVSTDGGTIFTNISNGSIYSGVTTTTLIITDVTASMNGYLYQAVFSNLLLGEENDTIAISTAATLIVDSAPSITSNPTTVEIVNGNTTTFTVAASANPAPSVQWQVSIDGGITYNDISNGGFYNGVTTDTLTITGATAEMNGFLYQAVFSNTLFGDSSPSITLTDSATLIVDSAASVSTNPTNQTVVAGDTISFEAGAAGYPAPSVQWQVSTDGGNTFTDVSNGGVYSGATSTTLNITDATAAMNGYLYQAIFSNTLVDASSPSTATTTDVTLIVDYAPTVTTDPTNTEIDVGSNASFVVDGSGFPSPSVQWQVSIDGGNTFTNISNGGVYSGATTDTLTITGATLTMDDYLYRAILSNTLFGAGSPSIVTTTAATLTLDFAPTVTADPFDATVNANGTTSFTAALSDGYPTSTTVQWQISTYGGTTFNNINDGGMYSGATTATLTIANALESLNSDEYRAIFSNASDLSSATNAATLTVDYPPSVTTNPSNETINIGRIASFTVAGSGDPSPSVQWQVSTDGGTTFTNVIDGGFYSGATTDILIITGATTEMNGYMYEAVFSNTLFDASSTSTATTSAAMLTVDSAPSVTTDPNNQTIISGSNTSITAAATGNPTPTIQWQVSTDGGAHFTQVSNGDVYSGATTDTLNITSATPAMNGNLYQAVFSNTLFDAVSQSTATTTAATLTVDYAPTVTTNPTNATVVLGNDITFTAAASGNPLLTVQWQVSTDGGRTFADVSNGDFYSGATTDTLDITDATISMNGYQYQAVFSNMLNGASSSTTTTTSAALLSVVQPGDPATSTLSVTSSTLQAGTTIEITLQAKDSLGNDDTGGGLTVDFALTNKDGGGQGTFSATIDNGDGTYTAIFTGTLQGKNTITASINDQPITTALPSITVTSGPIEPANSTVLIAATPIQLGGTTTITLQVRDAYDNNLTISGLKVAFALANKTGAKGTFSKVTDNHNGTYTTSFTGTLDGINTIMATLDTLPVSATAAVSVEGKKVNLTQSIATIASPQITAGTTTVVTLQAEYPPNQTEPAGGLTVAFKLGSTTGGQGAFSAVTDHGNGTYTAIFTGTLAGINTIKAYIDGQAVTSIAPSFKVMAGPLSLAKSPVTLSSKTMKAGGTITVTLQPEDAGGNKLILGSNQTIEFSLASGKGTFGSVVPNKNGTYSATFITTTAGSYIMETTINGQAVTSTAPTLTVTPVAVSLSNSVLYVSKESVEIGSKVTVTLTAVDNYGNLEAMGLAVTFMVGSGNGTFGKVTYAGNGIYQATFTASKAGSNTIEAAIAGAKIKSTAPINVTPG
jgi:hypothetical protein